MLSLSVRVDARIEEAEEIVGLRLVDEQGAALPAHTAGAHIDVEAAPSLVRQYSLLNPPGESGHYSIAVLREPASRGGSAAMHRLAVGDRLRIGVPRNQFALVPSPHTLLFGGGIGITPLLSMAEQLFSAGSPFELHYSSRSPRRAAFVGQLMRAPYASSVHIYHDEGAATGPVDIHAVLRASEPLSHVYACGPAGYLDFVTAAARKHDWAEDHIHIERFSNTLDGTTDSEFSVRIASTGAVYAVPPKRSIVEVLAEHGIDIPVSCEQGVCGTCLTRVLDGRPVHRDIYLTEDEKTRNEQMTPCCSRGIGQIVLDL